MIRQEPIYLTWLNNLGGFEYFYFTGKNMHQIDVEDAGITRNNILPGWPGSYGTTADTLNRQTHRTSRKRILVRSQHLSRVQLDALSYIRTSPLVQIVYSRNNRRTVLVDTDSFKLFDEQVDPVNQHALQFYISYTDEIPSQRI